MLFDVCKVVPAPIDVGHSDTSRQLAFASSLQSFEFCSDLANLLKQGFSIDAHPTLPSRLIPSSFCASTANSIGSCFNTSRAKPLTISATALSASSPRLIA